MDSSLVITIVSLLLVLVVTGMIAFMVSSSRSDQKRRTMNVIRGGGNEEKNNAAAKTSRRDMLAKKLKQNDPEKEEKKKDIAAMLVQSGTSVSVAKFWIFSAILSVVLTILVYLSGKSLFVVAMTAIIGFFGLPRFILKRIIARRQKKFLSELPDALEAMTRLLRAGMPVSEAIKMVAREFTGPIGEEMGRIFDQQKIGVSLPEAVQDCARRIPLPEVQMFATAVTIQAQTGSSLSDILEGLAKVIRARFRLRRKVQALSSEAKSSAMIIGALPIVVALGMYFLNPDYISILFTEEKGNAFLIGAGLWMGCGILIMKQMINFKI